MKIENELIRDFVLPTLLKALIKRNMIDPSKSNSKEYLWNLVREDTDLINECNFVLEIQKQFINCAKEQFSLNNYSVGVVLIATSIEQVININLRFLLENFDLSQDEITQVIRSTNIDSKLGWILKILSIELSDDLINRVKRVFEFRNVIVHYKAEPYTIDDVSNIESIERKIIDFGIDIILDLPKRLDETFQEIYYRNNSNFANVKNLIDIMIG